MKILVSSATQSANHDLPMPLQLSLPRSMPEEIMSEDTTDHASLSSGVRTTCLQGKLRLKRIRSILSKAIEMCEETSDDHEEVNRTDTVKQNQELSHKTDFRH
mmetsp:Transcript_22263/g.31920  ORF Transcript_22263/g.31920 Transcript_22263/m.31920 type:complete len:103 (+) Transcript_22263:103-411(+)